MSASAFFIVNKDVLFLGSSISILVIPNKSLDPVVYNFYYSGFVFPAILLVTVQICMFVLLVSESRP